MDKVKLIVRRIISYILVLFGLSILIFVLVRVMPGDTARMALGARASEEAVEALRQEMHLNESYVVQYGYWISGMLSGDFGESVITKRPVIEDIKSYLPATMELVMLAALFLIVFGIVLGVISTKYAGRWQDNFIRILSYFGIVAPAFLWAVLIMLVFAYIFPILPTSGRISTWMTAPPNVTGMYIVDYLLDGNLSGAWDAFKHIIMPSAVLAFGGISQGARITRSSMIENVGKPYASAEKSYGIPERKILFKYLLKPSMNATITTMSLDIAGIFGGAYLVEQIFGYPGLSNYGLQAMLNKDVFSMSAVIMVQAVILILFNLLADLLIRLLDPRVRYS